MNSREPPQLGYRNGPRRSSGLLARILTVATGALVLIGAIAISIVVFAFALVVILGVGLYLWWKTRTIRKQMREQVREPPMPPPSSTHQGDVIEGEVISKEETRTPR